MPRSDHEAEIGDVLARGMRVSGKRQPADDAAVVLDHEDRRVGVMLNRPQVAALVRSRAPARGRQDPASLLAPDTLREGDERLRVGRIRSTDADHATTTPAPPRRGSPAAASMPSGLRSTAETPPK